TGQFNSIGNQKEEGLSSQEKQELQNYLKYLKDIQNNNGQYLQRGGIENRSTVENLLDRMFGEDPFFQDIMPDNSNGGRDW
ncbi:hypothetical protein KAZ01_04175, partial [Candidatus Gracilibacteria bacterium]|nr:hypothetical protein [Candidatus Gracilibacteria bacterium]